MSRATSGCTEIDVPHKSKSGSEKCSRSVPVNAVLGLWPTVSSWAHSPNGWLDARHTARTPTGPATPATVLGTSPSVLLLWESFRKSVPGVAVSLCAGGATPQPVLRQGFLQTLRQPHGVPR